MRRPPARQDRERGGQPALRPDTAGLRLPLRSAVTKGSQRSRRARVRAFGLRTRLLLAFLLVAAVSAGTTAALTYREARNALLETSQDTAVTSFREQVQQRGFGLPVREEGGGLEEVLRDIARKGKPHPWVVFAEYGSVRASSGENPVSTVITPELRRAARANPHGSFERVVKDGVPYLTIAMPTVFKTGPGPDSLLPSGLVLFAVMPMTDEQLNVDALLMAARDGALPGLVIALIPGLIAARSVLRPVRELREAAQTMGSGRLDTRIPVRGSDELADLAHTFNESAAQLERSVRELREAEARARRFASDVSHELRTPLAGMLAVTEVLDEDADDLDTDTARAVRLVSAETGKLAVLVEDLMEISRFDARAAELNADEVDVAEAIHKTLTNRHWTDARVCTDLPEGIRARLDPRRFDVVVANLVGNALRHGGAPVTVRLRVGVGAGGASVLAAEAASAGPLVLTTEERSAGTPVPTAWADSAGTAAPIASADSASAPVLMASADSASMPARIASADSTGAPVLNGSAGSVAKQVLMVEVMDSGPGIRPESLPHIFDRFYKADAARTRSAGSGLGLAITLENVKLHGGTIRAGNLPGGGAVFTVEIPLHAEGAGG
ncbi:MAG: HAMP domain-containing protein [Streptomyces sp.]|nr:HAMP domain-containing protein [Streptomyces sp.]